jgi:hypothetical protein
MSIWRKIIRDFPPHAVEDIALVDRATVKSAMEGGREDSRVHWHICQIKWRRSMRTSAPWTTVLNTAQEYTGQPKYGWRRWKNYWQDKTCPSEENTLTCRTKEYDGSPQELLTIIYQQSILRVK